MMYSEPIYSTGQKYPRTGILTSIKAVDLKTCMYIVLDECRSAAQRAPQLHEVKESYNPSCLSPL